MKSFRAVLKPEPTSAERMDVGKSLKAAVLPRRSRHGPGRMRSSSFISDTCSQLYPETGVQGRDRMGAFRENKCKSSLLMYPAGCFSAFLTSSERWQTPACDSVLPSWATWGCKISFGLPRITAARTITQEALGVCSKAGVINFKDTLGLTNVPISSAAFTPWKKNRNNLRIFLKTQRLFKVSWPFSFYDSSCYFKCFSSCLVGLFHSLSND